MSIADLTEKAADAEREWSEYRAALNTADCQLKAARAAFKDDPTTGNGKELVKAEDAHKLAVLADQGATDRLADAQLAVIKAEGERALAELAVLDQASNLGAFEEQIAERVAKAYELRDALIKIEKDVLELAAQFTSGRRAEVLERARKLGTAVPAEILFTAYARARFAGQSSQAGVSEYIVEQREPRNFVADLLKVSAHKADERRALTEAQATQN